MQTAEVLEFNQEAELQEIDAATLDAWLKAGEAVLIDVREYSEFELERIPGALLMPLSFFDPETFPQITGKKVVYTCAVGKRSAAVGKQLIKAGFDEVIHLAGGVNGWKAAGFETEE